MHPQTILLPIGISFYTFKSLGYIIDVYRKVTKPEPHFGYFALYVSFFPQLIAGPIERANELIPQLHQTKKLGYDDLQYGLSRMAWGIFQKTSGCRYSCRVCQFYLFRYQWCDRCAIIYYLIIFCSSIVCRF
jgi:alginate O-acetyltransferase complex protein AlgI